MALQVAHLDNGVWTTRRVEISELLAQNRARRTEPPQKVEDPKPKIGLLSQTVIPSPTIQWALAARLRSKYHHDVVFVGERSIHLKEAVLGLHLEDVTTKSDFDANIIAAKVINASPELSWEAQMRLGVDPARTAGSPEPHDTVPPQILVLTLESKELVFLYHAAETPLKEGHFVHFRRPLPSDVSLLERFGRHIAVDPRSRAIAVAASADYFGVFTLKPRQILQSQMAQGKLNPISEERFFRVDGDILFMDFLYPKSEDEDRIILLLLVSKDHITEAICYDWDASESLRHARPRVTARSLPPEDRLPTILVPLTKATSFMLVTPVSMAVYKNVLDTGAERAPIRYPIPSADRESQRSPLWTRWARPYRNWLYNQKHDDIYLCREDGKVFYLEIGNEGEVEHQSHLGELGCDVDAAFDILDIGFEGGDLLLVAGNMGDGGLFIQRAREHPTCVQKFLNWAPIMDSVVVGSAHKAIDRDSYSATGNTAGDRLFACCGSTIGRGAVVELRYGIEARIGLVIALEDLSSTRDIWTMRDKIDGGTYLLISDPVSSTLLYLPPDTGEEIYAMDESESGLNFSAQTLAAGCTPSGVFIQVTDSSINLAAPREPTSNFCFRYETAQTVVTAAIDGINSLVATAVRSNGEMHIHLARVLSSEGALQIQSVGQPVSIPYEPISLSIESFGSAFFIFVGTSGGKLVTYRIEDERIVPSAEYGVELEERDDVSKAIESLARVNTVKDNKLEESTLFCGLRSGTLVPFHISIDSTGTAFLIELKQGRPYKLGQTSVRLSGNRTREGFALVTCGNGFWHLSHVKDHSSPDYTLQKIWITDQNNPAFLQKSVDVFTLIDSQPDSRPDSLSGSLVCISEGQLLICTLDQFAKPVPRRISLPGSANRLTYSKHLRSLIVAYTVVELDVDADPIRRYARPLIEFVDPDSQQPEAGSLHTIAGDTQVSQPWRPCGAAGEKITCILEWTPRRDEEEYHFIVIGTARKHQQDKGRVIFLQAQRDPANPDRIDCNVKHIHKFEGPVRAIAPYGTFTLMVATGYDIVPLEPKFSDRRWERSARFRLASPALSITVHKEHLYVSTARESLVVLKVVNDKLVLCAHDRVKREGLSHFHIGGDAKLTLASSRGGTVSALTEISVTDQDRLMPAPLSEAHLPLSVIRISPSSVPSSSSAMYGTTMDGAVYRLTILREQEWRLLRFLQNLCVRDPVICPFTSARKRRWTSADIEPSTSKPSHMHVDGDVLSRLLERGSSHLRQMLAVNEDSNISSPEMVPPKAHMERFTELVNEAFGRSLDPVQDVMKWLRDLLRINL